MTSETTKMHRRHRWVPADRRWWGLDRRTIVPAAIVLVTAAIMHWAVPWVNERVPFRETVTAGQTMTLDDDVVFTPPAGWGISDGVRTGDPEAGGSYPKSATVFDGATSITVRSGTFDGTSAALLRKLKTTDATARVRTLTSTSTPITTASGVRGVISEFRDARNDGAIAAFVSDGVGVEVIINTPNTTPTDRATVIGQVLSSLRIEGAGA
ncbi:hypothetical protein [Curtobacterium sp. ZW137]|uniref:hypothetical protein n=1 Tax=Curtobacterium sp. ZW137 TaxID=2485104 RepID=UPI000F4D231B|nr:hypothetical protein [Curtobacterium sp. ZW137]ROP61240.1 hypothetical protein EDF55_3247 [Curtobacterium sp. ZW137]